MICNRWNRHRPQQKTRDGVPGERCCRVDLVFKLSTGKLLEWSEVLQESWKPGTSQRLDSICWSFSWLIRWKGNRILVPPLRHHVTLHLSCSSIATPCLLMKQHTNTSSFITWTIAISKFSDLNLRFRQLIASAKERSEDKLLTTVMQRCSTTPVPNIIPANLDSCQANDW